MDPVRPELALVDPQLAADLRAELPEVEPWAPAAPGHEVARAARTAEPPPPPAPAVAAPERVPPDRVLPEPPLAPRRRRRSGWVVAPIALLALAVVTGSTVFAGWRRERPELARTASVAGIETAATEPAAPPPRTVTAPRTRTAGSSAKNRPRTTPKTRPRTAAKKPPAPPLAPTRVYAWAPVRGATAYEIRFVRGSAVVLEATVRRTRYELPTGFRLSPGVYRWTVQATRNGKRLGARSVDSRFTIADG